MPDLILANEALAGWAAIAVVVMFFATLLAVPMILIRLPADYFNRPHRDRTQDITGHPALRLAFIILKNVLGAVFVMLGIIMLVLPGQGVLTIVVGLMMIDFPGKYEAELWAVRHRSVLRTINWIRARAHRPPLDLSAR